MTTPAIGSPDWYYQLFGHSPRTVSNAAGIGGQLAIGIGTIIAASWANNAQSTPALYQLRDGTDATGQVLILMQAAAGGGGAIMSGLPGIPFTRGLFIDTTSGSQRIVVTYVPFTNAIR